MTFDPRTKLYFILLANLMLFMHVHTKIEMIMVFLFILPLFMNGNLKMAIRFSMIYGIMILANLYLIPIASGFFLHFISLLSVGIRMILPCIITGAYAFTTTKVGEFVAALHKLHIPQSIIIPSMVVIRFFPTIQEDYRQIRNSMALRGMSENGLSLLRHPFKNLEYVLIPLLINSNNVAEDLSIAALTKGIGIQTEHTTMHTIQFKSIDFVYMMLATMPIVFFKLGGM